MRLLLRGVLLGFCMLLVVALAGALAGSGYGAPEPAAPPVPSIVNVTMAEMSYDPREASVLPGDIVTWTNYGLYAHTVTSDPGGRSASGPDSDAKFPNGILPSLTFSWTVPVDASPGTKWFYHCRFYGQPGDGSNIGLGMAGEIVVK